MIFDVTTYLNDPIVGEGGTIILIPREVPLEKWHPDQNLDNPALRDAYLASNKPLPSGAKHLGGIVFDRVSIVRFDYPAGGTFTFRFAPAAESKFPWDSLKTKNIGVGSEGEEFDEKMRQVVKILSALTIHVAGSKTTEADSRTVESTIKIGSLRSKYHCRDYQLLTVCDASEVGRQ